MRVDLQPAYVLHTRAFRDTSLIVEVIAADFGRLSLVARGARRRRRGGAAAAILQPFNPLLISFSGRSEMKSLSGTEIAGAPPLMRGQRLFSALYMNELLMRLLHRHDPHPELFVAYADTLGVLASDNDVESTLRWFELNLLDELGYGFALDVEGHSGCAIEPGAHYCYQPDSGLVRYSPEFSGAVAEPGRVPETYAGVQLLAMAKGQLGGAARDTAKRLLRQVLATHLGPEPLRSRELFTRSVAGS